MSDLETTIRESAPALITYLTAGDPSLEETARYLEAMDRGGADVIEVGIPFSEPIAEGPTIQAAINRSLAAGTTPTGVLETVAAADVEAPLVAMTYTNVLLQFGDGSGFDAFAEQAAAAGLAGVIVPDLPIEEADPLQAACTAHGLDLVFIVAPTATDDRLDRIMARASGFAYVQARLGTTGARADVSGATHRSLERLEAYDIPKAVGFGVSTGEQAAEIIEAGADGVIVGSALVDLVASSDTPAADLEAKTRELKRGALAGAPEPEQP